MRPESGLLRGRPAWAKPTTSGCCGACARSPGRTAACSSGPIGLVVLITLLDVALPYAHQAGDRPLHRPAGRSAPDSRSRPPPADA
ncbi:MAG: hypothetical protein MZV70_60485 [Desulfobacterales bacterium]|nr:hypothetical protein [Desulfobacterales bacterium]